MFYAHIRNNTLLDISEAKYLDEDILNVEVSEDVFIDYTITPCKYIWDGENVVLNPDYEAELARAERERIAMLKLTKREVFLGLYQAKGVTPEQIKAQITDPAALIEFEYANDYFRGNPLIDIVGGALGISPEQLDKFFEFNDWTYLKSDYGETA